MNSARAALAEDFPGERCAYHRGVSPTIQAGVAALVGAVVGGSVVLAWVRSRRQPRAAPAATAPVLPPGIATVLSVLRSSAVVINDEDVVLKASPSAYALGLVRGTGLAHADLTRLVSRVRADGQIRESDLTLGRPGLPPTYISARVAPLGTRLTVVLVDDRTRERRLEAVRRDFVANVSHELKTPVGAVRLLAEAMRDGADDPEAVTRFSGRIITESERLTRLVQQIIELSRLQDDDPLESPVPVEIDQVVSSAVDTSHTEAEARGIEVVVTGESGLQVAGNFDLVSAAVANLVANAVTYSGEGSSVAVSTKGTDDTVEVSVIDQGIGIPSTELDRIFERFYRVDPARHRSTGGTGLGLSIVKHVAATHGGDVNVWSVEGQGSTFTLVLPRKRTEEKT